MRRVTSQRGSIWSHFLSIVFILLLTFLLFKASSSDQDKSLFYQGAFLVSLGVLFLFSYYYEKDVWLFSVVMYVSSNWSFPQRRWMAIAFGVVSLGLGLVSLLEWISES